MTQRVRIVHSYIPIFTMLDIQNPKWHYLIFTLCSIFKLNLNM